MDATTNLPRKGESTTSPTCLYVGSPVDDGFGGRKTERFDQLPTTDDKRKKRGNMLNDSKECEFRVSSVAIKALQLVELPHRHLRIDWDEKHWVVGCDDCGGQWAVLEVAEGRKGCEGFAVVDGLVFEPLSEGECFKRGQCPTDRRRAGIARSV